ncbi:hypothetical protein [Candidatus Nitrotoga sp. M5]|uniref:hypothetical protein n=1 Tax=Candidatus Nitrotoga sp. M5 TaxID=2890409 RepID=UPI001EF3B743|nr:hypothetical protein [Candidatus Nitrotoga sp. M5]CAH1386658.1 conserved hypothetical protein [Candidatus Nitrotoga sp. M5]
MKLGIITCLSIAVVWALLALVQLWFQIISSDVFLKLSITAGVAVTIVLTVTLTIRECLTDKEMKSKGFIDE